MFIGWNPARKRLDFFPFIRLSTPANQTAGLHASQKRWNPKKRALESPLCQINDPQNVLTPARTGAPSDSPP